MKLLVQPTDGIQPLIDAIDSARERIEIAIFRFDRSEIEKALVRAVQRGVFVHALIAYTNRGGQKNLRNLEMRLLEKGMTVARTADDLVRYHGKYIVIDHRELLLLGFNFTYLDTAHSRSFGIITKKPEFVREAIQLFEADSKRQSYSPGCDDFVVSPINARERLTRFIRDARTELLMYDPKLGDPVILSELKQRQEAGVRISVIGRLTRSAPLTVRDLTTMRLHTRTFVRDREEIFLGSQSLRATELETRREVGVIFKDPAIVSQIVSIFDNDWREGASVGPSEEADHSIPLSKAVRKVAKAVSRELPEVSPVVEVMVRKIVGEDANLKLDPDKLQEVVKSAVKEAVEATVLEAVETVQEEAE